MLLSGIITYNQTVKSNTVFCIPELKRIPGKMVATHPEDDLFSINQVFRLDENPHVPVIIFISLNTYIKWLDGTFPCKVVFDSDSRDLSLNLNDLSNYRGYKFIVNENTMRVLKLDLGLNIFEKVNLLIKPHQIVDNFHIEVLGLKDKYYEMSITI